MIVHMIVGELRDSYISSYLLWRPPIVDLVDVSESHGIVDFTLTVVLMLMMMLVHS